MNSKPIPPGAERTLAAALFSYTAQRPEHVANVLEGQAVADLAEGFAERARLYREAAALLRGPGFTYSVWQRLKLVGAAFAATWRNAVHEVDLEVEARERRARESHGSRRGRIELGAVLVLALVVASVLGLLFAAATDAPAVLWIAGGALVLLGSALVVDRVAAAIRIRRALAGLAEIDRAFEPRPAAPAAPSSIELALWRTSTSGDSDKLLTVAELEAGERVRLAVQRETLCMDGIPRWIDSKAWRVTSSGAFEREERGA